MKRYWQSRGHTRGRIYRQIALAISEGRPYARSVYRGPYIIKDAESGLYELWEYGAENGDASLVEEFTDLGQALEALVGE